MSIILRAILCSLLLIMGSASTAIATHGRSDLQVPIGGYLIGVDQPPDVTAAGCAATGASLLWRFTGSGQGRVSHLGRVSYEFTHCTHVDSAISEGLLSLTAANGDELEMAYQGRITQYTPGDDYALWSMDWTVVGGTGRFEQAAGAGAGDVVTYAPPFPDPHSEFSLGGTITYDASNRSRK